MKKIILLFASLLIVFSVYAKSESSGDWANCVTLFGKKDISSITVYPLKLDSNNKLEVTVSDSSSSMEAVQDTAEDLNCTEANSGAIKTAVEIIDNAISGNEVQVDIVTGGAALARKESTQDLSSASLSYTTNFAAKTKVKAIMFHASVAITETVTFSFNSGTNANYDTTIATEDLTAEQSYLYVSEGDFCLLNGDEITVICSNANTTGTVYVTVIGETLN